LKPLRNQGFFAFIKDSSRLECFAIISDSVWIPFNDLMRADSVAAHRHVNYQLEGSRIALSSLDAIFGTCEGESMAAGHS